MYSEKLYKQEDVFIYIPNSFTPNSDQINDLFKPVISSGAEPSFYSFSIFNRFGEEIFSTQDIADGWNGYEVNKSEIIQGTYSYVVTISFSKTVDRKQYKGNVNLIR